MSALDGLKNLGDGLGSVLKGPAAMIGAVAEVIGTPLVSGADLLTLQPGKALDNLKGAPGRTGNLLAFGGEEIWNGAKQASSGLGQMFSAGTAFLGESPQGASRYRF